MTSLTDLRLGLLENRWHPLPVTGKRPVIPGWQEFCRCPPSITDVIEWEGRYPSAKSTGIAVGRQVVIDIDVSSDAALADRLQREAFDCFGTTPFVRVGRAPKVALVYRAGEDIGKQGFKAATGNGDGIDILGTGAQFVAFGIHPDTGRPYEWVGPASPKNASPEEAPGILNDHVQEYLYRASCLLPFGSGPRQKRADALKTGDRITRDPDSGLVVDGREYFLHLCVWNACLQMHHNGDLLLANSVAELAWSNFSDPKCGAHLLDNKWTFKHALSKARGKVRQFNSGSIKLTAPGEVITPAYPDRTKPIQIARQTVRQAVLAHLMAVNSYEGAIQEGNWHVESDRGKGPMQP